MDETMGPTGRWGRAIPTLLFGVEMLADIVGRRDIDDWCDMRPTDATDDKLFGVVDGMLLCIVVPTRNI